ncbi:MAG: hypothetical protein WCD86_01630 [Ktedonobacteraceae bacterium]
MSQQPIHPLTRAREKHNLTQKELAASTKLSAKTIWGAEHNQPISAYSRRQLCKYFKQSAAELGLVSEESAARQKQQADQHIAQAVTLPAITPSISETPVSAFPAMQGNALPIPPMIKRQRALETLIEQPNASPEEQSGAWLALGASHLGQLFNAGWTVEAVLTSLGAVLKSIEHMPAITRRQLLELGSAALLHGVTIPDGSRISETERAQLTGALGKSIAESWRLSVKASTAQILAIGQTQLYMLRQTHSYLYPNIRAVYYSSAYNLIGLASQFQGHQEEAFQAHETAYLAALEGADALNMAQSLTCQANIQQIRGSFALAQETIDRAMRLVSQPCNQEHVDYIRLHAHLLALSAENAAHMVDLDNTQRYLDASAAYLQYLPDHNEEFDRASWSHYAGICATHLGQYDLAIQRLEYSRDKLAPGWNLRYAIILTSLVIAYAMAKERDKSVATAEQTISVLKTIQAPRLNRQFIEYAQCSLISSFPGDKQIRTLIDEASRQLLSNQITASV